GGWTFVRLGSKAHLRSRQPTPTMHGGFMHAEDARHRGGRFATLHQFHGTPTTPFQFCCCSGWSCHTSLYGCPDAKTSYGHAGLRGHPVSFELESWASGFFLG